MPRRPKTAPSPFNGLIMEHWRKRPDFVAWAMKDPMFSQVLSVMSNGMLAITEAEFPGYQRAMANLLALRQNLESEPKQPPADYSEPPAEFQGSTEQATD